MTRANPNAYTVAVKFLPGVVYVTCTRCKGNGRIQVPMPEFPAATRIQMRIFNHLATSFMLSMGLVLTGMLLITAIAGVSPWEIARRSILAGLTVLVIAVAGAYAIQWILYALTTQRCPTCLGRRWVPGQIPPV